MSHVPKLLHACSRLLSYPDEATVTTAELLYVLLQDELPDAARDIAAFGAYLERHDLAEVEEAFTQTFDINPISALEVGWHLFGEEYTRGLFLVRMREELRRHDLAESAELPDHLSHVLAVVAAMPAEEAARFVRACVQPAVESMGRALWGKESPYEPVMRCLTRVLAVIWGAPEPAAGASSGRRVAPFASDPLRAFPVADVVTACGMSCQEPIEIAPLPIEIPVSVPATVAAESIPTRKP